MVTIRSAREAERGQTLPIWTLAVLTALTLMFFSLNYANVIRWQVRAQSAADSAATAALSVQANQWNKMMTILYAADVEEWRIRHLIQGMIDTSNGSGGCVPGDGNSCLRIYQALQVQYYKSVNRYTAEVEMLQSLASIGAASQTADAATMINHLKKLCDTPNALVDCAFTYHIVDYSYRTTTQQAGKDAFFFQLGGFSSPQDRNIPVADWEPARIEIVACANVRPIINFSVFGTAFGSGPPVPFTVIGRSAATNVPQTAEWFAPGSTQITSILQDANALFTNSVYFQSPENYDVADDTFAGFASPRDWYETQYPATKYLALPSVNNYVGPISDDFEVMVCWWAAIPYAPYTTAVQSTADVCAQS